MNAAIPAPGGNVGIKTLAVYVAGATAGLVLYQTVLTNYIPDNWEQASIGPVNGAVVLAAATAIVAAGIASRFVK